MWIKKDLSKKGRKVTNFARKIQKNCPQNDFFNEKMLLEYVQLQKILYLCMAIMFF